MLISQVLDALLPYQNAGPTPVTSIQQVKQLTTTHSPNSPPHRRNHVQPVARKRYRQAALAQEVDAAIGQLVR